VSRRGARSPRATLPVSGGPFGFSLVLVSAGSDPGGTPLCRLPVSSKPFCPTTAPACAMRVHLSWGFLPLQRSTKPGVRLSCRPPRPPRTVRPQGFSPSRRLFRLTSCRAWATGSLARPGCTPRSAPGVSRSPIARTDLSIRPGRSEDRFPLHGFLLPRDESVLADSPFLRLTAAFHARPSEGTAALRVSRRFKVSIAGKSALTQ